MHAGSYCLSFLAVFQDLGPALSCWEGLVGRKLFVPELLVWTAVPALGGEAFEQDKKTITTKTWIKSRLGRWFARRDLEEGLTMPPPIARDGLGGECKS